MANAGTILIIGTCDTKGDEIAFMCECVTGDGGQPLVMDVSVLGDPPFDVAFSKHDVAAAAGTDNAAIIELGDENHAMTKTAEGASNLAVQLYSQGKIDAVVILGGTMGTDLALDVAAALPLGVPKVILSTVAFSPLLPPDRIAPDLIMMLWAGGLYGLNSICKASLSQAVGAALGAARVGTERDMRRPLVAISALGLTSLKYHKTLKPALEARGFEVAVFHATGMGGRAIEQLAAQGALAAVLDFCLVEVSDHALGSPVHAGAGRLSSAGRTGTPQMAAAGGVSLVDALPWSDIPEQLAGREFHQHNRLITCAMITPDERRIAARAIAEKLNAAEGETIFFNTLQGIDEWDREGGPLHDPEGLRALTDEFSSAVRPERLRNLDCHINDAMFSETVLEVFDEWLERGIVSAAQRPV